MGKPVVGVMGGSKADATVEAAAHELGALIARRGWILLNGGRDSGVMAASARGAKEAGGMVVGVLPDKSRAKASTHLDIAILTGIGDARNLINIFSSDLVIACRGELGTLSEIVWALKRRKRVILLGFTLGTDFDRYRKKGQLTTAATPKAAVEQAAEVLAQL